MTEDARLAAHRRQQEIAARAGRGDPEDTAQRGPGENGLTHAMRATVIDAIIEQAIRRGEFDDLPGTGKPLEGLDGPYDPDWWIRRKIETEKLRGLGPPALTLRVEDAELDDRLDELASESEVRDALEEFNERVVEARRQLLGGPPVITPTRDVEAEVDAWRERRAERQAAERPQRADREASAGGAAPPRRRRWWPFGREGSGRESG